MRKTAIEIIDETVAFYSEDVNRRAVVYGKDAAKARGFSDEKIEIAEPKLAACMYHTNDGRQCAFGRCMVNPHKHSNFFGPVRELVGYKDNADHVLKEEYHGHSLEFWGQLQRLHDINDHWNEFGLTKHGEGFLEDMKKNFGVV
jgi:hypothetical protein